jgi:hypothetical protein
MSGLPMDFVALPRNAESVPSHTSSSSGRRSAGRSRRSRCRRRTVCPRTGSRRWSCPCRSRSSRRRGEVLVGIVDVAALRRDHARRAEVVLVEEVGGAFLRRCRRVRAAREARLHARHAHRAREHVLGAGLARVMRSVIPVRNACTCSPQA